MLRVDAEIQSGLKIPLLLPEAELGQRSRTSADCRHRLHGSRSAIWSRSHMKKCFSHMKTRRIFQSIRKPSNHTYAFLLFSYDFIWLGTKDTAAVVLLSVASTIYYVYYTMWLFWSRRCPGSGGAWWEAAVGSSSLSALEHPQHVIPGTYTVPMSNWCYDRTSNDWTTNNWTTNIWMT